MAWEEQSTKEANIVATEIIIHTIKFIANCRRQEEKKSKQSALINLNSKVTRKCKFINTSADAILQDIQHLLVNPTTPANVPPDASAYSLTNKVLDNESRDGLNEMDEVKLMAETESCDKDHLVATEQRGHRLRRQEGNVHTQY